MGEMTVEDCVASLKILKLLNDCGEQKKVISETVEMAIQALEENEKLKELLNCAIKKMEEVSRKLGQEEPQKDCSTCYNNQDYPPTHTCDECTSLDNEEEYSMWKPKEESQVEWVWQAYDFGYRSLNKDFATEQEAIAYVEDCVSKKSVCSQGRVRKVCRRKEIL